MEKVEAEKIKARILSNILDNLSPQKILDAAVKDCGSEKTARNLISEVTHDITICPELLSLKRRGFYPYKKIMQEVSK